MSVKLLDGVGDQDQVRFAYSSGLDQQERQATAAELLKLALSGELDTEDAAQVVPMLLQHEAGKAAIHSYISSDAKGVIYWGRYLNLMNTMHADDADECYLLGLSQQQFNSCIKHTVASEDGSGLGHAADVFLRLSSAGDLGGVASTYVMSQFAVHMKQAALKVTTELRDAQRTQTQKISSSQAAEADTDSSKADSSIEVLSERVKELSSQITKLEQRMRNIKQDAPHRAASLMHSGRAGIGFGLSVAGDRVVQQRIRLCEDKIKELQTAKQVLNNAINTLRNLPTQNAEIQNLLKSQGAGGGMETTPPTPRNNALPTPRKR